MLQLLSLCPAEAQKEHQKRLLQYRQFYNNNNNYYNYNNNKNDDDDDDSQIAIFSVPYTNMQLLHFSNIPRIFMYAKKK